MRMSDWSSYVCSSDLGLGPQFGRIADRQAFETAVDGLEITLERGRLHARIDAREATADIDHVEGHRRLDDRLAHALHRVDIGFGRHRLADEMDADAERVRRLAGGEQKSLGLAGYRVEFGREDELGRRGRQ